MRDTIFALSSGSGAAGIAVWRISGPKARQTLWQLARLRPEPRRAAHVRLRDDTGAVFDDGIALFFPGPASSTGEDVAEVHSHGGVALGLKMQSVLRACGLRSAAAGEFTRRAFAAGRLDLLAVEALGDLIAAETPLQLMQAMGGRAGEGRALIATIRESLLEALALLEAAVDFPDEEDVPEGIWRGALPALGAAAAACADLRQRGEAGLRLREGVQLAIVGAPNAGKSSMLNRLLAEERAMVSDVPGTTRDVISARLLLAGRVINVLDTAGLRAAPADALEAEGMRRTVEALGRADIILSVGAPDAAPVAVDALLAGRGDGPRRACGEPVVIEVWNKSDLGAAPDGGLGVSALTGAGWPDLLARLETAVTSLADVAPIALGRQLDALDEAAAALARAGVDGLGPELRAEDVRRAMLALDRLIGRIGAEEVLGAIFGRFCIGK